MKTPKEIISWCECMLERKPNVEDTNYFVSIIALCERTIEREKYEINFNDKEVVEDIMDTLCDVFHIKKKQGDNKDGKDGEQ